MTVFSPFLGPGKGFLQIRQLAAINVGTRGKFGRLYLQNVEGFSDGESDTWQKNTSC